jgi:LuxR family maltose regulon positive regulatory protein
MNYISSKFSVPKTRTEIIQRKNLFKKLDEGITKKFLLISAPAGYGKTSLVSSWIDYHEKDNYAFKWIIWQP